MPDSFRWFRRLRRRLVTFCRPRYIVWRSVNGLDWIPTVWSRSESKVLCMAAMFAARRREFHVEVTDQWRNGKEIWYISADINKLAEYHRKANETTR